MKHVDSYMSFCGHLSLITLSLPLESLCNALTGEVDLKMDMVINEKE